MRTLPRLVAQAPIDKQIDVDVLRKGEKKTLQGHRRAAHGGGRSQGRSEKREVCLAPTVRWFWASSCWR